MVIVKPEIIDGNKIAEKIRQDIKRKLAYAKTTPGLAVILVGDDPASQLYVKLKERAAREVGIRFEKYFFNQYTREEEIIATIEKLNHAPHIHGIIVQLPLPRHLDEERIIKAVNFIKDVDGFHPHNIKNLLAGSTAVEPNLPKTILTILKSAKVKLKEKNVLILGKSEVFTEALKIMLERKKAQVMIKRTGDLFTEFSRAADILIVAIGQPRKIKADMIKEGVVIIDVGITHEGHHVVGDVDFEDVKDKVSKITPVPGGVGPVTVACLLENTYLAAIGKI
jgi:methylenetetrahydrofolate dehydrogenase (NADP+)/methenyltetrahydrofolate cyclohydrolase